MPPPRPQTRLCMILGLSLIWTYSWIAFLATLRSMSVPGAGVWDPEGAWLHPPWFRAGDGATLPPPEGVAAHPPAALAGEGAGCEACEAAEAKPDCLLDDGCALQPPCMW